MILAGRVLVDECIFIIIILDFIASVASVMINICFLKILQYMICRGFVNRSVMDIGVWRFVEGVNTTEQSGIVVAQVYLASDPATVARLYVLL
jgi:hypothetical protein